MPRHARGKDARPRRVRLVALAVVWVCGLIAAFFSVLAATARYGCATGNRALACRTSGSVLGWLLVAAVIVVIIAVTIMLDRPRGPVLVVASIGVATALLCLGAATGLLAAT